ncbi:MAG: O-antigen ligase family protein [Chthoniobacterales bacterium]
MRKWIWQGHRWLFFAALIYAPWAYGCTTPATMVVLNWMLGGVVVWWGVVELCKILFHRDVLAARNHRAEQAGDYRPRDRRELILCSIISALLVIGWWMVWNAGWIYDPEYAVFLPINRPFSHAAGSLDVAISTVWMLRATLLLLVVLFVADLTRKREWLLRLWWAVGLAGGSIALLGLLQKASGAEMIFWQPAPAGGVSTFFASYYYHANAGAFLNLTLPPVAGLALRTWTRPAHPAARALWLCLLVIMVVAVFSNTSRAAELIALVLIAVLALGSINVIRHMIRHLEPKHAITGVLLVGVTLWAVARVSHLDQPLQRWQVFSQQFPVDGRWLSAQAAVGALPRAGMLGSGPGTFRVAFRFYTGDLSDQLPGVWRFLHQDYLQTLLEWGWLGGACWAALFFGGIWSGLQALRRRTDLAPRYRSLLMLSLLALTGVALHALVDFPLQIASLQLYVATYLGICWGGRKAAA